MTEIPSDTHMLPDRTGGRRANFGRKAVSAGKVTAVGTISGADDDLQHPADMVSGMRLSYAVNRKIMAWQTAITG